MGDKLSKADDFANVFFLIIALGMVAICTFFLVYLSVESANNIIKWRQDEGAGMIGGFLSILHFMTYLGAAMFWGVPAVFCALPVKGFLRQSDVKAIRIISKVILMYALCGIIACFVVCFGLPRWI